MNKTDHQAGRVRLCLSGALLALLAGCTTYVEQPRPRVYVEPSPPAEIPVAVVQPSPPPPVVAPEAPPPVVETVVIREERDFYEPLRPYGRWVQVAGYGRCWIPTGVDRDWRPYSNGHWRRTDAGWYWVSDEPWGWATYHYGRWDWNGELGWIWVPQTQWAPAWVSFHQGGGYTGWAPLHPAARMQADGSLDMKVAPIPSHGMVLVEDRHFLEPVRPATVVVNNTTIINQTVNITNVRIVNNTVINEGPHLAVIEQASGQKVRSVAVHELRRTQEAPVLAARRSPPVTNPIANPVTAHPATEPRENKAQLEAERRANELKAQQEAAKKAADLEKAKAVQVEEARRTNEARAQAQADTLKKAKDAEAKAAQAEALRRTNQANAAAQAEALKKTREIEAKAAQADAERRTNQARAQAQADALKNAKDAEVKAAQAEALRRTNQANAQAQARAEALKKAKEAEAKAAQARLEDQALAMRVKQALAMNAQLKDVTVTRTNGIIHLNGAVNSAELKKLAGVLAGKIEGVHDVQNSLTVRQ